MTPSEKISTCSWLRYVGVASNFKYDNWNVDASGKPALATSGKLFVPFEVGDSTHALTLCLTRSDWARGESFVLSHCELTRVT